MRWVLAIVMAALPVLALAQEAPALKTEQEKRSCAMGMDLGGRFKVQSVDIDPALFAATQERVDAGLKEAPTPGYGTMDLRVGAQLKQLRLTVALDNVFDRLCLNYNSNQRDPYRTGARVPEPGRNLYASVAYKF